ncbi:MAG: hypothetical protein ABI824_15965 [Acidobacteriota bacterium]
MTRSEQQREILTTSRDLRQAADLIAALRFIYPLLLALSGMVLANVLALPPEHTAILFQISINSMVFVLIGALIVIRNQRASIIKRVITLEPAPIELSSRIRQLLRDDIQSMGLNGMDLDFRINFSCLDRGKLSVVGHNCRFLIAMNPVFVGILLTKPNLARALFVHELAHCVHGDSDRLLFWSRRTMGGLIMEVLYMGALSMLSFSAAVLFFSTFFAVILALNSLLVFFLSLVFEGALRRRQRLSSELAADGASILLGHQDELAGVLTLHSATANSSIVRTRANYAQTLLGRDSVCDPYHELLRQLPGYKNTRDREFSQDSSLNIIVCATYEEALIAQSALLSASIETYLLPSLGKWIWGWSIIAEAHRIAVLDPEAVAEAHALFATCKHSLSLPDEVLLTASI